MGQLLVPLIAAATAIPGLVGASGGLTLLGSVVAGGISLGLAVGANALLSPRAKRPKPSDIKSVVRAPVAARSRHYGRVRVGGSLGFVETTGGGLHQNFIIGEGPNDAFEAFIVDGETVTTDAAGFVQEDPYAGNTVRIITRLGGSDQVALPELKTLYPAIWTDDHRLRGLTYALLMAPSVAQERFNEFYPNRFPELNCIIRGAQVYDPRTDTTSWSQNLPLIWRDYLTHPRGARISEDLIDDTLLAAAADIADELLPTKAGGTVPRYHGALSYAFNEDPADVLARLLAAMDGRMYLTPEGKIGLLVGKWIAPTITITDDHVLEYQLADGTGPHRSVNEVVVHYTNVDAGYSEATADPWRDEADIAANGEIRPDAPELYEIQHHHHARRIAKISQHRANPDWVGTVRTTLFGMEALDQRWITLQIGDLDIDDTFEVTSWALDTATKTVVLNVSQIRAEAYDFDAVTEEGTAPATPPAVTPSSVPTPDSPILDVIEINGTSFLEVSWNEPATGNPSTEVRYREVGATEWTAGPTAPAGSTSVPVSLPATQGTAYEVEVRHVGFGKTSPWVATSPTSITPTGPTVSAPTATTLASSEVTTGSYAIRVAWAALADSNLATDIRYKPTGFAEWTYITGISSEISDVTTGPLTNGEAYEAEVRHSGYGTVSAWVATTPTTVTLPS